ncbi:5309_t:CDS:10 [Entrophospora sp. SA101]|nr:6192_t:CDS:10 [Entrophospora sp. SA101]CAJ0758233.1 5309_t:CDS:10 [Entrophospora sp. SA101]
MKFSKSFQSEAVPEWKIKYIDYKGLKKKLRLVQKARISRERELSYPLSNRQTPLQYDKNQGFQENQREVIEKDEEIQMDDEFHHHSYPHEFPTPITPPPPLNTSRRTSYQSQTSQGRFSFTGMAETANSFMRGVSWKLHNNPKRQSISENNTIMDQVNPEERVFFVALEQELEKVKIFYDSQEKEAIRRFAILQQQLEDLKALKNNNKKTSGRNIKQSIGNIATRMSSSSFGRNSAYDFAVDYKEAKKKIRKAIFEFYRGVKMLNEYRVLNKLGFIKILKKYDISSKRNGSQIYLPKVKSSNFIKSDILNLLIKDVEGRQIACFYYRVEFRDFFIADVLNSLSYSFTTMRLLTCIFNEDCNDTLTIFVPLLGMIPATIRMIHCLRRYHDTRKVFPHLINALKYLSTMIPLWALYFDRIQGNHFVYTTWIISQTIATLYAFSWDVLMDWSLFSLQSENYLLRDHLVYNENWIYYAGIAVNFFLRSSWVFILIFPNDYVNVALFIAIGEIIRRWIWNFFRVENEHVNNCGQFRAIKDVPLPFEVAPIQIKIGEEIINSDSKTDSVDDMIIDDKESPVSTNWLVNLIRSNRANGTSKKDDWKDFEATTLVEDCQYILDFWQNI